MDTKTVYFSDRYFSTGVTDIWDEQQRKIGELDLQSMFTAGIHLRDERGSLTYSGKFRFFSNGWIILDRTEEEVGVLKAKLSFFSKRYIYENRHGTYEVEAPAFSREYTVTSARGDQVAEFRKTDGMFGAGAFALTNDSSLPTEELILVVMGVHAIQKRQNSAAT